MQGYERKKNVETTEQVGLLKRDVLCRGKVPHDYVLVLPEWLQKRNQDVTPEQVEQYYQSEERMAACVMLEVEYQRKLGLDLGRLWRSDRKPTRNYECSRCFKKEYNIYE